MKKIYFLASLLLIGAAASAQLQNAIVARSDKAIITENAERPNIHQDRAPGDVILTYEDDFSNAANWTVANSSSPAGDWTIDATGAAVGDPFASTTAANGFAWYDADATGVDLASTTDATLTYNTVMDFTGYTAVAVEFESYYIEYQTQAIVQVSTNGMAGPWTDYEVHLGVTDNNSSANPTNVVVNVSSQVANQSTVAVRFHYVGGWGFQWSVDDFAMVEAYEHELETTWANFSMGTEAVEYYSIPTSQITEVTFGSLAQSNGITTQTNVEMTAEVDAGSTYSGTSGQSVTLMEGQSDTFSIEAGNGWTPTAGTYDLVISVGSNETEQLPVNNDWAANPITVGGNVYARDDGFSGGGFVGFISTQGDPIAVGNVFEIMADETFGKIDIGVTSAMDNEGSIMYGAIYKWNGAGWDLEMITDDYTVQNGDLGTIVSLELPANYDATAGYILVAAAGRLTDDPLFATAQPTYVGSVIAFHSSGELGSSDPEAIIARFNTDPSSVGIDEQPNITGLNIFPNPADESTQLTYFVVNEGNVTLTLTDLSGKVVYNENFGSQTKGEYKVELSTSDISNGVYFYTLTVGDHAKTKKFVVSH